MPIIWRYLLGHYLKVLGFCVVAFIAILLSTRMEEIAKFATLGGQSRYIALFTLYQIPYILPIAIPISCLISSIILFQRLSLSCELTALRACGLGIRQITSPILVAGAYIALLNFFIVSELATQSHFATRQLEREVRSVNPLLLLQNSQLLNLQGIQASVLGPVKAGESAGDVVLGTTNHRNGRLNLIIMKNLLITPSAVTGDDVTVISSMSPEDKTKFDHLVIENIKHSVTPIEELARIFKKERWTIKNDHLRLPMLLVRTKDILAQYREISAEAPYSEEYWNLRHRRNECFTEISRRISVALAAFTFTLLGTAFGISIGRTPPKRRAFFVVGLAALYLAVFFIAKGMGHRFVMATLLYTVPHLIIIGLSIRTLSRVNRGIEG